MERNWEANSRFDDLSCQINDIFHSASIMIEGFLLEKDHIISLYRKCALQMMERMNMMS